jgi:YD repeat-containing protein
MGPGFRRRAVRSLSGAAALMLVWMCAPVVRQLRPVAVHAGAFVHQPWRTLHKGHADIATGVYIREDDDLVVNTPFPIVLRRTYNSGDKHPRQFGIDATHPGEWWLYGDNDPRVQWGDLILADGGRIRFTRTSPGSMLLGAVFRHDSTPTDFNGAVLSWIGFRWRMTFPDGSTASFLTGTSTQPTSLIERTDPDGHRIEYARDRSAVLLKMASDGQSIALDYDGQKRITRAYDTSGHEVIYRYDERGRLVRATKSDGEVREYTYDAHDNLTRILEPGRIVENWFDGADRWRRQVVKSSEDDPDPYVATVRYVVENGSVVESDFDEGNGLEISRYNSNHYVVSETLFADSRTPVTFKYDVDPVTNMSSGASMSCTGTFGSATRSVQVTRDDDAAKEREIARTCILRR